ncbi:c-type cytochrome [Oceanobacillus sp. 143]|jgi:cytochrome c550|uniref:Cytochrome C n=1 Tax=Oceanobacillus zhaokaii TaxID=2052660 RepID=A0A345PHJ7_9BACI|nr:cytochrome c [Oceanobacillus zhaokaii]AXI09477.1 cytochrome C [Oceanobacillus zhaokaii]QGS68880.1 c-type cytochrome [Oceanobacillus sp. 143]
MKRNSVLPFAIIAIIGVLAVIIISFIGVDQRADRQAAEEGGNEQTEDSGGEVSTDPEEIFQANCAACHGADLSGGMGPELTTIGSTLSAEDIVSIIQNGKGQMPAQTQVVEEEATLLADWLSEKQ